MEPETFIGRCINEMISKDVTIHFNKRKNRSKDSGNSFGFTDSNKPIFTINYFDADPQDLFETFIHEYCHFRQWQDDTAIWRNGILAYQFFYDYLDGITETCSKKHLINLQLVELDADRRALKLITRYDLPIDKDLYIKESNAYTLAWKYQWMNRELVDFPDYSHPEILTRMPNVHFTKKHLMMNHSGLLNLFDNYK